MNRAMNQTSVDRATIDHANEFGHPIGPALPDWTAPPTPPRTPMLGRYAQLEPFAAVHADALWRAMKGAEQTWTYLTYGPFADETNFREWFAGRMTSTDPLFFAIRDRADGLVKGWATLMRIDPANGVIEVGNIWFSPLLARGRVATDAMFLMMAHAFALGYRRYEWKCDALNAPSRAAAVRLGFTYEGIFRQALVYKRRSRDTAWYAMINSEWPLLRNAFEAWLAPENFDSSGRQRTSLSTLTAAARK